MDFELCRKLSDSPAAQARALLQLGRACLGLGRAAEAREHLGQARKIDGEHHVLTDAQRREISELLQKAGEASS